MAVTLECSLLLPPIGTVLWEVKELRHQLCVPFQDLFSALIKGPTRTPYEDGLYLFDIQLPNIYPAVPPHFCYLSQCSGRLNPNLYDNGKVCVSLLGTWIGKVRMGSSGDGGVVWGWGPSGADVKV